MSEHDWRDSDEALDRLLAGLGDPEGAQPTTSPAEILGRAALLTPPVVGLAGWKLAAVLAVAVGGGVGGGWLLDGPGQGSAEQAAIAARESAVSAREAALAARESALTARETAVAALEAGLRRDGASPEPTGPVSPSTPAVAWSGRRSTSATLPGATIPQDPGVVVADGGGRGPADCAVVAAPVPSEPEPARPEPTERDLEEIDDLIANVRVRREDESPAKKTPADKASENISPDEPSETELAGERSARALAWRVGAGAVTVPGASTGMLAELGARLAPGAEARAGWFAGTDLDLSLLAATPGSRWSAGLDLEAGRAWRLGRAELSASWTLGGRLVLPARAADKSIDPGQEPEPGSLDARLPPLFAATGPRLGLSLGQGSGRPTLSLGAQVAPGAGDQGPQTLISLVVGTELSAARKKDG